MNEKIKKMEDAMITGLNLLSPSHFSIHANLIIIAKTTLEFHLDITFTSWSRFVSEIGTIENTANMRGKKVSLIWILEEASSIQEEEEEKERRILIVKFHFCINYR